MFHINSQSQKPNHALALEYAEAWCKRGFRFNREAWQEIIETTRAKKEQLLKYGLQKPDSPKQVEWFLRSFNSLELAAMMYDLKKGGWDLTVDALCEVVDKFTGIPEIQTLYEYKQAKATASSFESLERYLNGGDKVYPKVQTTSTNRLMFVEPFLSGLPKKCRPFTALSDDAVLLSVDVKAQEPNIIINWFGSPSLKAVAATETDIYTGVAKAAYLPKVILVEAAGSSETPVIKGVTWLWGEGDTLLYLENIHQSSLLASPKEVIGVFESGARRELPIKWIDADERGIVTGVLDLDAPLVKANIRFRLQADARQEVKDVWSVLAYGGSQANAKAQCSILDGSILVDLLKTELDMSQNIVGNMDETYFGTQILSDKRLNYRSIRNRRIQGTGADLMALLIERYYSETRPDGMDIYLTRYDELVLEVPLKLFENHGDREGLKEYLTDIFEHQVDDFTPFRVEIDLF